MALHPEFPLSPFQELLYAQRFGAGISLAQTALTKSGNPPARFEIEQNFVAAIITSNQGASP